MIHAAVSGQAHLEEDVLSEKDVEAIRKQADETVEAAVEFADASPEPPLDSLYDHLYVLEGSVPGWYAVDERSPDSHPGEAEREAGERARELAERGAAYADEDEEGHAASPGVRDDSDTDARPEEDVD